MLADAIRMTSSTGGTGTLTCSAQTGYPLVSNVFTGTRFIQYSIAEYTSSAKTQLSKFESGIGSYNTSTEVLTRTLVQSTWDGTNYRPKFGTATAPSALSFGSTSANIDIMISLITGGARLIPPAVVGAIGSVSDGVGIYPINVAGVASASITPTSGTVYYFPVELPLKQYSQAAVRQGVVTTGGSPTIDIALYEVNLSDGLPGKQLVAFTQKAIGTASTIYQTTALATPVICGGWLWAAVLYLAGGGTGTTLRSMTVNAGSMLGSSTFLTSVYSLASQTVLNDPATAPTANTGANGAVAVTFS